MEGWQTDMQTHTDKKLGINTNQLSGINIEFWHG